MVSRKAVITFICAVIVLGGTLTWSAITRDGIVRDTCKANNLQNHVLKQLLENAEVATIEQLSKEVNEGREINYTVSQIKDLYSPTYKELRTITTDC